MKKLIIVNGVPGVGKTALSSELNMLLNNSVWLDGDWCWMMNPFVVNDENKRMVEDNIVYLLGKFLNNSSYDHIIFSWVIPKEFIFDIILDRLDNKYELYKFSLISSAESLKSRMRKARREEGQIADSIKDMELYMNMGTVKLDTSDMTALDAAKKIAAYIGYKEERK